MSEAVIETIITALTVMLGGAAGAALVNFLGDRWKFKAQRAAVKEDREEEKQDKTEELSKELKEMKTKLDKVCEQNKAQSEALKLIMLDRILWLGKGHIARGEISFDDKKILHEMHNSYHYGLGGNGDADWLMDKINELQIK